MDEIDSLKPTLDGTWSKKWKEAQKDDLPKHLIDNKEVSKTQNRYILCSCGEEFDSVSSWAKHATEKQT